MPTESDNQAITSSSPATSPNDQKNGCGSKHTTMSHDPTAYVARARVTRPEPPKPSYNPMQFVQIKPCNLFKSAQEQLKRAEEVKKVKEIKKEEPEEWQNNLDNWKSSRRKRVEHIIDRVVEVKKLELEEHDRTRRKSATFSEMLEKRGERGRGINKLASLSVYNEDESNDLSDLGIGASSVSGKSSISEDYDSHSAMTNNDKEDANDDPENNINNNGNSNNDLVINEGGEETNNRDTCEYTYESAIQDYKTRVSRASSNGLFTNNNVYPPTDNNSPPNQIRRSSKIEEKLSSFEGKPAVDDSQTIAKADLPKVDISKRKELFEAQQPSTTSNNSQKRLSGEFTGTKSIKERLSNLEKKPSIEVVEEKKAFGGDVSGIRERLQNVEKPEQIQKVSPVSDVPVPSLKDRLSSLQSAATKEKVKKPVLLVDEQQVELMRKEDEDLLNKQKLEAFDESFSSSQEVLNVDTDREDSGIHTTDVSCSVSQTDEQPEISHINDDTLQEPTSKPETPVNLELSVSVPSTSSSTTCKEQSIISPESRGDGQVDLVLRVDSDGSCKSNASSISHNTKLTARESLRGSRLKAFLFENSDPLTQINELKSPEMGRKVYDNVMELINDELQQSPKELEIKNTQEEVKSPSPIPNIQITLPKNLRSGLPKISSKDIQKELESGRIQKILPEESSIEYSELPPVSKRIENFHAIEKLSEVPPSPPPPPRRLRNKPSLPKGILKKEEVAPKLISKNLTGGTEIFNSKKCKISSNGLDHLPKKKTSIRRRSMEVKNQLLDDLILDCASLTYAQPVNSSPSPIVEEIPCQKINVNKFPDPDHIFPTPVMDISVDTIKKCDEFLKEERHILPSPPVEEIVCDKIGVNNFPDYIVPTSVIDINQCDERKSMKSKPSKIPISSFLYGPQGARRSPVGSPIPQKKLDSLNGSMSSNSSPLNSPSTKRKSENVLIGKLQSVETKLKVTPSEGEFLPSVPSSPKVNHKSHPQNGKPRNIFEFIRRNLYSSGPNAAANNEGEDCGAVSINNSTFYVPIEDSKNSAASNKVNVEITKTIKTEKIIEHSENSEDEERNNEICDEINQMLDDEIAKLNEMEQNL